MARTSKKVKKAKRFSRPVRAKRVVRKEIEFLSELPEKNKTKITEGAGFGIRLLARSLDMAYVFVPAALAGLIAAIFVDFLRMAGEISPGWPSQKDGSHLITLIFFAIGSTLYHFFMEGLHGSSIGKLICGLRVLQANGRPCGLKGAWIRTIGYYFDGLFFGLVGLSSMDKSPLRQRYGDVWGNTVVVKAVDIPPGSERTEGRLVLALILGSVSYLIFALIGLVLRVMSAQ